MSRAIHRTDHKGGDDFGKARPTVRRGRRSIASAIEVRDNRSVAARVFSWVANKIPDRYLNRALALVIGLTGFFGWRIHNQLQDPGRSSQAIAAAPDYPQYSLDRPLPSPTATRNDFARNDFVGSRMALPAAAPAAAPKPIAKKLALKPDAEIQITDIPAFGVIELGLRPGYQLPRFDQPYQKAARRYIENNEGYVPGSFRYPVDKTMVAYGCYVEANPDLFIEAMNCSMQVAQGIIDGNIAVKLNDAAIDGVSGAFFADIEKVLKQKCTNRGVDFDTLPDRAKIALLDTSYIRPAWVDDKLIANVKAGNYAIAAFRLTQISNAYVGHATQRGLAERMAKNSWLMHNATKNRGQEKNAKFTLSSEDVDMLGGLAAPGVNQAYVPVRTRNPR